jgi:dipeptidyl-peptidase-3
METNVSTDRPYLLEQIDDAAVVQLYADGFGELTREEKILVWHLYQAALAGRDIYYDQRYAHALAMRDILEEILEHAGDSSAEASAEAELSEESLAELRRYTKLFWLNTGPYNNLTARKFTLDLSRDELVHAAECAWRRGARFRLEQPGGTRITVEALVDRYAPMFLDASVDPMVTCKTPENGADILLSSANNLYENVTMADLERFEEKHPLNSRVVKRDGAIVEEVYRIGGRYHDEIARIVGHLEAALPYAQPSLARALSALITWYRTGEESDREAFDIAWVQNRDSSVDTMNGFIEVYMDARGIKGAWEGIVYYVNHEKTEKIRRLAEHAQAFEDRMPVEPRFRKPVVQGISATAIEVVVEAGDSGPITPVGVNLPNDQRIREEYGSKSVTLSNVVEAYDKSQPESFRVEFSWSGEEAERAERWGAVASELTTEIHEVLGHGSGRMAAEVTKQPQDLLKEQYSALEETRADLVALYFVADPLLAELGIVPAEEQDGIVRAEYEAYARNALVQLRRVRVGNQLEEDHMRNRQTIVHWLLANTSAIEIRRRHSTTLGAALSTVKEPQEKTYYVVVDVEAFRRGVATLLGEVQRIKSEGDYGAAKRLFETYGVYFDPSLRDEVVARVDRLKLPSYTGFVMPKLEPVVGADGAIEDIRISYPCSLSEQMLEYSAERRAAIR